MIRLILLCLALLVPQTLAAQQGDETVDFAVGDPVMGAARAAARDSLPLFLSNVTDAQGMGAQAAAIKVSFPTGDAVNSSEVIWVAPFAWDGVDGFYGLLANAPNFMGDLREGDPVEFTRDMVADWSFSGSDGMLYGNYSTRVMLPRMSEDEIAYFGALLSDDPVPAGWD